MFGFKRKNEFTGVGWTGAESTVLGGRSSRNVKPDGADIYVIFITLALLAVGSLMVYSATVSFADSPKYQTTTTYFLFRHLGAIAVALVVSACVYRLPMRFWERQAVGVSCVALLLLILVLIPGIGKSVNGARRWLNLGVTYVQVTEFVKIAVVIGAAAFTVKRQEYMHSFTKGFAPMFVVMGITSSLIGLQPDLGATVVVLMIAMGVLFLGGLDKRIFTVVFLLAFALGVLMIYLSPWRLERMISYTDVWAYAQGKGYQLSHSLIAFGRGELWGVGLGASVEKLHYLPEAHTDFILSVIAEELGFVGVFVILFAFYWLVRRAFEIGRQAVRLEKVFSGLVAQGVGVWIGVQVFINGGVVTGLLPTKGLTLPLISYGGSSLLATMVGIALLLRVDRENRILMRGGIV